jgi:plastocyanin
MFSMTTRLGVALVIACGPSVSAPPTATPTPAVQYTTVESATQPAGSILVEMTSYAFKPADIPLKAGKDVLYLVNASTEVHSMALRNPSVSITAVVALSADVEAGHSAVFTIENLRVGMYRLTCPITNHASAGMIGTATATAP